MSVKEYNLAWDIDLAEHEGAKDFGKTKSLRFSQGERTKKGI